MRKFISILFAIVTMSIPCAAATRTVPIPYPTIQAGINAAVSGVDTVEVAVGTYYENINFNGKNITLTSTNPYDPNIVRDTIIDGNNSGSVVTFSGTETSSCQLRGFTITNGNAPISGNYSYGGGFNGSGTNAAISNCVITGNSSNAYYGRGGGLYNCDGPITNCIISNNTAEYEGGGLRGCGGAITNCTISGNSADWGGGLKSCDGSITNCTITGNSSGAALIHCNGSITNCTITGNSYYGLFICNGTITNCIIWGNSGVQLVSSSTPTYSCIQNWKGGGVGNINSDPLFVDEVSDDYHLQPWSRCIDDGTNSPPGGLPATDQEGNPRPIDGNNDGSAIADMGAYEAYSSDESVIWLSEYNFYFYAREDGKDPNDQILLIDNWGQEILNWSIIEDCNWLDVTPESGSSTGEPNVVTLSVDITGLTQGNYNCDLVVSDPCSVNISGTASVTLTIGDKDGILHVPSEYPTIKTAIDIAFYGDEIIVADGVYTGDSNRNIQLTKDNITVRSANGPENCIIDCEDMTRGFYIDANSIELEGFTITNGYGSGYGGGIYFKRGNPVVISNCIITNNQATYGGGIFSSWWGGSPIISNCTILSNSARKYGGGLYRCNGKITNCTIADNFAIEDGGGLYDCDGPITNCIIWGNTAGDTGDQLYSSVPTYSCIHGWSGGGLGNINSDPLLVGDQSYLDPNGTPEDPSDDFWIYIFTEDLHLKSEAGRWDPNSQIWVNDPNTSPCIDAGNPGSDWTGELWPDGGRINMGAYGGTAQASMSLNTAIGNPADFNKDDVVDYEDFSWFFDSWQREEILLAEDINRNNFVDILDIIRFAQEWLWEQ